MATTLKDVHGLLRQGDVHKALALAERLQIRSEDLDRAQQQLRPPYEHFVPVAFSRSDVSVSIAEMIVQMLEQRQHTDRSLLVGVAGPSGAGKSHLIGKLETWLTSHGTRVGRLNQDQYFISDLAARSFSGHAPQARTFEQLQQGMQALARGRRVTLGDVVLDPARFDVLFCYSNAALLWPEVAALYDLKIGVTVFDTNTLLERRFAQRGRTRAVAEHFTTKTLPDIRRYTLPSLQRSDVVLVSDLIPNRLFARDSFLQQPGGDDLLYGLSLDTAGWDRLWAHDAQRFTDAPTPLCCTVLAGTQAPRRVLEIGPGATGRDAMAFIEHGAHYTGIEISAVAARLLAQRLRRRFGEVSVVTNLADLPAEMEHGHCVVVADTVKAMRVLVDYFPDFFSLVYAHSALHYMPPSLLRQTLRHSARVAPMVAIGIKTAADRTARMGDTISLYPSSRIYENATHRQIRFFHTRRELRTLLGSAGFTVTHCSVSQELFDRKQAAAEAVSPFLNIVATTRIAEATRAR